MRLSEVKDGAPIILEVFEGDSRVTKIWGRVSRISDKASTISIFCFDGESTNFSQSKYTIKATAYFDGAHEIDFSKEVISGGNVLTEKRDDFRIYVGEPSEGFVSGREATVLLVDIGHGGFRIMSRDKYKTGSVVKLTAEFVEPEAKLCGRIVWEKVVEGDKYTYGCVLDEETARDDVIRIIEAKQKKLQDEINAEIEKNS